MSNITIATVCLAIYGVCVVACGIILLIFEMRCKPRIEIDGHTYIAINPTLKTVHGKTGEVVIGGFKEVQNAEGRS